MIYTGYFNRLKEYEEAGLTPICIAGYPPKEINFTGIRFPALAPKKIWWQEWHDNHLSHEWYEQKYNETVLNRLSAVETSEKLRSYGEDVILLCVEKPSEFCHRHLVSKWFRKHHIASGEYQFERT